MRNLSTPALRILNFSHNSDRSEVDSQPADVGMLQEKPRSGQQPVSEESKMACEKP